MPCGRIRTCILTVRFKALSREVYTSLFFAPTKTQMKQVTLENLKAALREYRADKDSDPVSEAMFFAISKFGGVYILHDSSWAMWFGLQNSSARFSWNGRPFVTIRDALHAMLTSTWPPFRGVKIYLSTNAETRLRFIANQLASNKEEVGVLMSGEMECTSKSN